MCMCVIWRQRSQWVNDDNSTTESCLQDNLLGVFDRVHFCTDSMTQRQEKPQSQHIAKFSPKEPCNTAPGTAKGVWRDASRCNGRVSGAACFSLEGLSFYVWGLRVGYLFFSAAWLHRDLDNLHKWEGGLMTTKRGLGWGILKSC